MKKILVTGATSGIGKAFVLHAADKGYQIIACGRNIEALNDLSKHPNITGARFDVGSTEQTETTLATLKADIYILNAGVCEYVDIKNFEVDMFHRVFNINFFGVVNCVNAILPNLVQGNQLVMVDSLARLLPFTRSQAYGTSKAALHYFCKSMEVDLADKGVTVQNISPGFVETPLTAKNDFDMPMSITAEKAVKSMLRKIEKRKSSIYFPWLFSIFLRILGRLPDSLKVAISKKLKYQ